MLIKLYLYRKNGLFVNVRLESIECHADAMEAQFPFVFRRKVGVSKGIGNRNTGYDAVYPYGLSNIDEVANYHHRNARAFDFLCDR